MKIGLVAFVTEDTLDPATVAKKCERLGFDAMFMGDHPTVPVHHHIPSSPVTASVASRAMIVSDQLPEHYAHMPDPFVALTVAAAATSRIKLGTGVCVITEREPIALAKTVATLDLYSNGRFLFCIGTGNIPEESAVMGADFRRRWPMAREYVRAMKELWTKPEASFEGEFVRFPPLHCYPKPVQKPHPPVLIGAGGIGSSGCLRAMKDTVALADGWGPAFLKPEELAREMVVFRRLCMEAGRDFEKMDVSMFIPFEYEDSRRTIAEYAEAGAHRLVFTLWPPLLTHEGIEALARRYLN